MKLGGDGLTLCGLFGRRASLLGVRWGRVRTWLCDLTSGSGLVPEEGGKWSRPGLVCPRVGIKARVRALVKDAGAFGREAVDCGLERAG